MTQCRLLWASLDLCQSSWKSRCNKSELNIRCYFSADLSWVKNLGHIGTAEHHPSMEHLHPQVGLDKESTPISPFSLTSLSTFQMHPLAFFSHSSMFEVFRWFLPRKWAAGCIVLVTPCSRRAAAITRVYNMRSFSSGVSTDWYPTRTWPRLRRAISTCYFQQPSRFPAHFTRESGRRYLCWRCSCKKCWSDNSLK